MTDHQTRPIACDLDALGPTRARYLELRQRLGGFVREVAELPDGLALGLPATDEAFLAVAEWITLERRCCPFLDFALDWRPAAGALSLRLTGGDGVKPLLAGAFASRA